jgi:hypothetical protein
MSILIGPRIFRSGYAYSVGLFLDRGITLLGSPVMVIAKISNSDSRGLFLDHVQIH